MALQLLNTDIGMANAGYCYAVDDDSNLVTGLCCRRSPAGASQVVSNIVVTYVTGKFSGQPETCCAQVVFQILSRLDFQRFLNRNSEDGTNSHADCNCVISEASWKAMGRSSTGDRLQEFPRHRTDVVTGMSAEGSYFTATPWRLHFKWPGQKSRNRPTAYSLLPKYTSFAIVRSPAKFCLVDEGWLRNQLDDGLIHDDDATYVFPPQARAVIRKLPSRSQDRNLEDDGNR